MRAIVLSGGALRHLPARFLNRRPNTLHHPPLDGFGCADFNVTGMAWPAPRQNISVGAIFSTY